MNWKETINTIKANYARKHIKRYTFKDQLYIYFANTIITAKIFLICMYKWIKGIHPGRSNYQNEKHIFKAWFSELWANEMMKWYA